MTERFEPTERTKVRRKATRGAYDATTIHAILDEALVCHVGFATPAGPVVLPTTHARIDDRLYIHGSAASHMLTTLAGGLAVCVTVTLLDGLVFSRTAFHHSVNYRSVVVFGHGIVVEEPGEKRRALDCLVDKLAPARSSACRAPNEKELVATKVIAVDIHEASAKIRRGPPLPEDGEDAELPYWAGVVRLLTQRGAPESAPDCALAPPANL